MEQQMKKIDVMEKMLLNAEKMIKDSNLNNSDKKYSKVKQLQQVKEEPSKMKKQTTKVVKQNGKHVPKKQKKENSDLETPQITEIIPNFDDEGEISLMPKEDDLSTYERPQDFSTSEDESEPKYCYCNRGDHGKMIACENKDCPREWFHFVCVGIKHAPPDEWFCNDCKSKKLLG